MTFNTELEPDRYFHMGCDLRIGADGTAHPAQPNGDRPLSIETAHAIVQPIESPAETQSDPR
ncbi:MAG TPA: hypothetical protein PLH94_05620 [Fimbriimonadaceae bacterium]|nr:hypothetical protein [Fimbriimonadaceae bacterium]